MLTPKQLFEIHGYYEDDRYIFVGNHSYHVVCPHLEPIDFINHEPPKMSKINNKTIELREYRISSGESTFTGKCEVCGKVYYRN